MGIIFLSVTKWEINNCKNKSLINKPLEKEIKRKNFLFLSEFSLKKHITTRQ